MLKQIKERLNEGKKCIVIATSLVEAGVDLDFCTVYRQIAGMDLSFRQREDVIVKENGR